MTPAQWRASRAEMRENTTITRRLRVLEDPETRRSVSRWHPKGCGCESRICTGQRNRRTDGAAQ